MIGGREDELEGSVLRAFSGAPPCTLIAAFEGWNDAGDASTLAVQHLYNQMHAEVEATIEPEMYYDFTTATPRLNFNPDRSRYLTWPSNELRRVPRSADEPQLLFLRGVEPNLRWRTFSAEILELARERGVTRVIMLGGLLSDVPHTRPVQVFGSSSDKTSQSEYHVQASTYEGPTGIVGVLSAAFAEAGVATVSLWAAVPSYMPAAPSPKAALALVQRVEAILGLNLDKGDLIRDATRYETEISRLVERDDDSADYVARMEERWDADKGEHFEDLIDTSTIQNPDPDLLVAEVEEFLRDSS